ncbi:MAG TPA: hypothetical protein VF658_06520 [Pyrinomonadaceae bacterium]|jgi:hypothetical protein
MNMKTLISPRRPLRQGTWLLGGILMLMVWSVPSVTAQESPDESTDRAMITTYNLYDTRRSPGEVLAEGNNTIPEGKLGVKTWRLEEVKLPRAFELDVRGQKERVESVLRLTITGNSFRCGSFLIWVGDNLLGDVSGGMGTDLTTIIFDRSLLEDGATIAVSCERPDDPLSRSVLPERLYLPPRARSSRSSGDEVGAVTRIRKISRRGQSGSKPYIQIELTVDESLPVQNASRIVQIGTQEFYAGGSPSGDGRRIIVEMTLEKFAQLEDGAQILVKNGRGAKSLRGARKFGRLNKGALEM